MPAPRLRLIDDPRARFWGSLSRQAFPNSLLLNWLDLPETVATGHPMAASLWAGFSTLNLQNVAFTATAQEAPAPEYRRITPDMALAEGKQAFLEALDFEKVDSWYADQCYFALPADGMLSLSDPEVESWLPFWSPQWTGKERPQPTRLPRDVPLLLKVDEGEDAAWALAFANSSETRDRFAAAVAEAAQSNGMTVTRPDEQCLFSPEIWATHGPAA